MSGYGVRPNMVKFEDIPFDKTDLRKKEFTDEELMDIICRVFPGSWLPYGKEGLTEPAKENITLRLFQLIVVGLIILKPSKDGQQLL